jgi:hypothetical protein
MAAWTLDEEENFTSRAIRAWMQRMLGVGPQPARCLTQVTKNRVKLFNSNGHLATYEITASKRLRWVLSA